MKKKIILLAIILAIAGVAYFLSHKPDVNDVTDQGIRQIFYCDRKTKEARATDYYCKNPDAYRKGEGIPKDYLGI